jgi:membrane fusion protein, multidrug efflux system
MKNLIIILITAITIVACNKPTPLGEKQKELAALKSQVTTLNAKIKTLETEIAKLDTGKKAEKVAEIGTMDITPQIFKTFIDVQGHIDADQNVSVSSQIPGTITKINVTEGQQVTKGQVLAETDASALQLQIASMQTNLDLATQVFQKQQNLWNQKIGSELQYLQAKTNKENLEKSMSTMYEQVRMSKIISPINGTIDAVNIKLAQSIAPGMPAINVVNYNNLKVKAEVAETYSSRIKNGNTVQVFFPDMSDSITGKISFTSRSINPITRTFNVEIPLSNNKNYHPNMVAKLKINDYQSPKPEIVIPVKFIQKNGNELFVLVAENNIAIKKVITTAKEYNGMVQIASGINIGDKLITEGYDLINEGDKITLKK